MRAAGMERLRLLLFLPMLAAMVFVVIHLVLTEGDITRVRSVFGTGFLFGLVMVPVADPNTFPRPLLIQLPAGCLAGTLMAAYTSAHPGTWMLGTAAGGLLAWSTRFWVGHFPFNQDL